MSPPSRQVPFPGEWSVRQGRDAYLIENGFTVEAYDDSRTKASILGVDFSVPNTPAHRIAIMWHDLHHVVTGFGTDLVGEAEVSAWELRRGLAGLDAYVSFLVVSLALLGVVIAPLRTFRAFWISGRQHPSLFPGDREYEAVLAMSISELRDALGVSRGGIAAHPRKLHSAAPA